jgi:phosphoenolpyruvate carboxykinase (GTP)
MRLKDGEVQGSATPAGILPTKQELELDGLSIEAADLDKLLTIDVDRWRQEAGFREAHLAQFTGLPEQIWEAHRSLVAALDAETA